MRDGGSNLLDDFRQGNPASFQDAFESLFRLHQRAVYGWLLRIVRDRSAAEDLTIETFWRIFRVHARFDPARGFEGWARTIATHVAMDWLRAHRPEVELVENLSAPGRGDAAVSAEIRMRMELAFRRLPPKLRVAAILAVVEELPAKEVAAALCITVGAVKVRVFRALRLLRKELERQGITP